MPRELPEAGETFIPHVARGHPRHVAWRMEPHTAFLRVKWLTNVHDPENSYFKTRENLTQTIQNNARMPNSKLSPLRITIFITKKEINSNFQLKHIAHIQTHIALTQPFILSTNKYFAFT